MGTNRKHLLRVLCATAIAAGFVVAAVTSSSAEGPTEKRNPSDTAASEQSNTVSQQTLDQVAASAQGVEYAKAAEVAPQAMADTLYLLNAVSKVGRP
jgi:hypothetical protein